jgi:hypothetical protein
MTRSSRIARVALFTSLTLGVALATFTAAEAQNRGAAPKPARTSRPAPPKKPPPPSAKADAGAPSPAAADTAAAPLAPRTESAPSEGRGEGKGSDAGAIEAKTLDGGARVFRFGEVEIEGRLRNPQLVYFLRRVRAEFAAGDLGHRTFMRELSETRKDPNF